MRVSESLFPDMVDLSTGETWVSLADSDYVFNKDS